MSAKARYRITTAAAGFFAVAKLTTQIEYFKAVLYKLLFFSEKAFQNLKGGV
ncbi:MAG: hypothetical protein ACI4DP_06705 [Candidatus Ornithomonoglobus sp.]